ncbi:cytochrome P450 94A2-like [Primulina huaijiensis]|uniref:cytochrome P450 94A2-like n=1 Tax=Primulina huaijiensis TaxID=1492673 RepID=UPI003CC725C7
MKTHSENRTISIDSHQLILLSLKFSVIKMEFLLFSVSLALSILLPLLFLALAIFKNSQPTSSKFPRSYPIFGSFLTLLKNKERYVQWTSDLALATPNLTYTMQSAFERKLVVTANAANVKHILKSNFQNYNKGPFFRETLRDLLGDGIINADGETWMFQRQVSSHEFNTNSLRKFVENVVNSELSDRLIPILKKTASERTVLDFQDILQRFAFDNICKIAFGYDPKYLLPSLPEAELALAFENAVRHSRERFNSFAPLHWKIKRALNIGSEKQLKIAVKQVRDFAKELIRGKKHELQTEKPLESVDLLSRVMSSGHSDEDFVVDIVINFILAGRDTTSAALTWFFWLLSSHPEVENQILKEIEENADEPSYDEVKDMIYTHAALCESMRLYPPVPSDTKSAVSDDVLPDGTVVKKGMRVAYHPYAMGRVEKVWGADQAEFRPMRWLERKGDNGKWSFVGRDSYTYPVFQAGPRICLGKDMAFLQMKTVVAGVLRQFKVVPVVEEGKQPVYISELLAKMKGGFPVRIEERAELGSKY